MIRLFWKEILIVLLISISGFFIYNYIYSAGKEKAAEEFSLVLEEYNKKLDSKIKNLEDLSTFLVKNRQEADIKYSTNIDKKLSEILVAAKDKPLTIVENNKCTFSSSFADSYNQLILGDFK